MKAWILAAIIMLFPAHAATLYVDNSGGCSDSGGTEAMPFCTIKSAVARIGPGDTVYVKDGTYNEAFSIEGIIATADRPTIITAYPGHKPTVHGLGWDSGRIGIYDCRYLELSGFRITNSNHGIKVLRSSHISIRDNEIFSIGQEGIQVSDNCHNIEIVNNHIHGLGHYNPSWGEGIYIGSGSGASGDYTNNVLIRGNLLHDIPAEAIELKPRTYACTVEENTVHRCTTGPTPGTGAAVEVGYSCFGSDCAPEEPRHVIRNNMIHEVTGDCMNIDTSATVYNNVVYGCSGSGIMVRAGDNHLRRIYHNTVDMSANAITLSGTPNLDMQNNIGPASGNNIAASSSYFAEGYRLAAGAAPVDAGADLRAIVPYDIEGRSRDSSPDIGAYEYSIGIPEERLAPGGWHDLEWHDPGGWTAIDVTTRGIEPGSDVTQKLKSLIDSLTSPTVLFFPAGRYIVNDLQLSYQHRNIIFRGTGDSVFDTTTGGNAIRLYGTPAESGRPIIEDVPAGSRKVKVTDASRYQPGDIVGITADLENYVDWGKHGRGGVFRVEAVQGNEITLDRPLAIGLDQVQAKNAVIQEFLQIENIAIEKIRFIHTSKADDHTVVMRWADNIMIRNCTFVNSTKNHVQIKESRDIIVRDSYFYEAQRKEGGHGYAVASEMRSTGVLITNNIFQDVNVCLGVQIGTSYLIYSYNLCIDRIKELCNSASPPAGCSDRGWITDPARNGLMVGNFGMGFTFHGHYPHHNLVEGNVIYGLVIDHIWKDNGPHNTVFRNKIQGLPPFHSAYWLGGAGVHIDGPSDSQNIIGNVFMNGAFIEIGTWSYDPPRAALDTFVGANVHADIRKFSNSGGGFKREDVADCDDLAGADIPDSLYLDSRPDFWPQNLAWPPFGPDAAASNKIPAQLRFEAMQGCRPITAAELMQTINDWKRGLTGLPNLMSIVREWKRGCA